MDCPGPTPRPLNQNVYRCVPGFRGVKCLHAVSLSHVSFFATPWTRAHQAPLSVRLPRQEYCAAAAAAKLLQSCLTL